MNEVIFEVVGCVFAAVGIILGIRFGLRIEKATKKLIQEQQQREALKKPTMNN